MQPILNGRYDNYYYCMIIIIILIETFLKQNSPSAVQLRGLCCRHDFLLTGVLIQNDELWRGRAGSLVTPQALS